MVPQRDRLDAASARCVFRDTCLQVCPTRAFFSIDSSGSAQTNVPSQPHIARRRSECQTIAHSHVPAISGSRSKLDRGEGGEGRRHTPGAEPLDDLRDSAVTIDEEHIDWKSHPARVNRIARRQHQRATVVKIVTSEEPATTRRRIECGFEHGSHEHTRALIDELCRVMGLEQWAQEVAHAVLRAARRAASRPLADVGTANGGSISRSREGCPDRNSRKSTVQSCVERKLRNRL